MTTCYGQNPHGLVAGPFFVSETVHRPGLILQKHEHATYCFHSVLQGEYSETTSRQEVHIDPRQGGSPPPTGVQLLTAILDQDVPLGQDASIPAFYFGGGQ